MITFGLFRAVCSATIILTAASIIAQPQGSPTRPAPLESGRPATSTTPSLNQALIALPDGILVTRVASPEPRISGDNSTWRVQVGISRTAYEQKVVPVLKQTLMALSTQAKQDAVITSAKKYTQLKDLSAPAWMIDDRERPIEKLAEQVARDKQYETAKQILVALNTGGSPSGDNLQWSTFLIDQSNYEDLQKAATRQFKLRVKLVDATGSTLKMEDLNFAQATRDGKSVADQFRYFPWAILAQGQQASSHSFEVPKEVSGTFYPVRFLRISPFVWLQENLYTSELDFDYTTALASGEAKKVAKVEVEFVAAQ